MALAHDPGNHFATLAGSSSVSATLTAVDTSSAVSGGSPTNKKPRYHGYATRPIYVITAPTPAPMSASLAGSSLMKADITFTVDFDLDLETLLFAGVL